MENQNNNKQQPAAAKQGFSFKGIQGPVMANGPLSLNLLPDVKKQLIKIKRERSVVIAVSMIAVAASAAILIAMSVGLGTLKLVEVGRRNSIKASNNQIEDMKKKNQLNKYLTIQNQLGQITSLKDSQQAYSRLLGYLTALNPASPNNVYLNDISVTDGSDGSDTTGATESGAISMTLQGRVQDFPALNVYKNTLMQAKIKYSERTEDEDDDASDDSSTNNTDESNDTDDNSSKKDDDSKKATRKNLFSSVVVSESGMSSGSSSDDGGVSFTIQLVFCPEAFSSDVTTPEVEIPKTLTSNGTEEAPEETSATGTNPNNSDSTNANETFHTDATNLNNNDSNGTQGNSQTNSGAQTGGNNE